MTSRCFVVAVFELAVPRFAQEFDPSLAYLARNVGIEPHDAGIDMANP